MDSKRDELEVFDHKNDDKNKLNSKWHTLFKTVVPVKEEPVSKKEGTYKKIPEHTGYRVFINIFFEHERGLHEMFNELWNAGEHDTLELRINSRGGFVNEGSQFYSVIKNKFNGRTTTVLDTCGYSMGALTFCMGDKRIITPRSDIMFHDYSGAVWGKGGEIESQFKHQTEHLRDFFADVILKHKFLTKKEFKNMIIGKDYWMTAPEMCRRGIATHVLVDGKEIKAKKYLKLLKKQK
ncbi:MAG: ATP-dependent Clp protease proteolytic subunit [Gammaproteobacteria bacterium]|nr:ATP-dependent Clp protease proteolytic subunit [Gammaproteobacteria bacterium]